LKNYQTKHKLQQTLEENELDEDSWNEERSVFSYSGKYCEHIWGHCYHKPPRQHNSEIMHEGV